MLRLTGFGLAACLWLTAAACGAADHSDRQTAFRHLQVAGAVQTIRAPSSIELAVSAVQIGPGSFLLDDYHAIYRLTSGPNGYTVVTLAPPVVPAWYPTGLAYRGGVIYVANYLGHDVLELGLSANQLVLERRITNPLMVGPENLAVGDDGTIAVADYDGSAVLQFGPDGALRWRVPLGRAHGVTESGGAIYASSLLDRTITKLDQSGRTLGVAGAEGSSPGRYVWPVGLADVGDRIVVTDAHDGRITVLDHSLRVLDYSGVNGPGLDALNFPYATLPLSDGYLILDTFKQRLVRTDRHLVVQAQIELGRIQPAGRDGPILSPTDAQPYTYPSLPGVDVAAALGLRAPMPFVGGYGGVVHVDAYGTVTKLDLSDVEAGSPYATWAVEVGPDVVTGSPENPKVGVIDKSSGLVAQVDVGYDVWWQPHGLLASGHLRDLAQVIRPALAQIADAKRLLAAGLSREGAFSSALNSDDWSTDLTSPAAQLFLRSGMTREDANIFFTAALTQPDPRVVELAEVKFLSGA